MFKKRESVDILDIPDLHRRKLIKLPEVEKSEGTNITKEGYFDLSQNTKVEEIQEVKKEESQVTSFLSDFASIGASEPSNNKQEQKEENSIKDLKWRIENLEFKLEQLIERVNSTNK